MALFHTEIIKRYRKKKRKNEIRYVCSYACVCVCVCVCVFSPAVGLSVIHSCALINVRRCSTGTKTITIEEI